MGIEADVSTCLSLPKPHGRSRGELLDPEAAGRKRQPVYYVEYSMVYRVSSVNKHTFLPVNSQIQVQFHYILLYYLLFSLLLY